MLDDNKATRAIEANASMARHRAAHKRPSDTPPAVLGFGLGLCAQSLCSSCQRCLHYGQAPVARRRVTARKSREIGIFDITARFRTAFACNDGVRSKLCAFRFGRGTMRPSVPTTAFADPTESDRGLACDRALISLTQIARKCCQLACECCILRGSPVARDIKRVRIFQPSTNSTGWSGANSQPFWNGSLIS